MKADRVNMVQAGYQMMMAMCEGVQGIAAGLCLIH